MNMQFMATQMDNLATFIENAAKLFQFIPEFLINFVKLVTKGTSGFAAMLGDKK